MSPRPSNIVLIGFMGVGKTTLARQLAKRLAWAWKDTDQEVEKMAGRSASRIFAEMGEPAFRDLEGAALESLLPARETVISTGGGTVLRTDNRDLLRKLGWVVALFASEEVIWERVSRNQRRPLLQTPAPRETMRGLLQERLPLYRELADLQLDTSQQNYAQCISEIIRLLKGAGVGETRG